MRKRGNAWRPWRPRGFVEFVLLAGLSGALLLGGCSRPWSKLEEGSYERGRSEVEGGALQQAIDDLKLFIRRNPQDPRAAEAQFLVAKAYMDMDDYPVAAVEFEILQVDYPTSSFTDAAAFLEAMCYAKQVPDYRLDQTVTYKAVEKLQNYLRQHPSGEHVEEARQELAKLQDQLERKHFEEAAFYKRRGYLDAAHQVFENILSENPSTERRPRILLNLAEIDFKLENFDEAQRHLQEIIQRWPESSERRQAEKLLKKIEKKRAELESEEAQP